MIILEKTTWLRTLLKIRGSALVRIWRKIAVVTAVAAVVSYLHDVRGMFDTNLTAVPFQLVGVALGIFLGFRNNTAYDRFWEGRKLWGGLVNTSRTMARQLLTLVGPPHQSSDYLRKGTGTADDELRRFHQRTVRLVIAYVNALRLHLRNESTGDLEPQLEASQFIALTGERNPPLAVLQTLSAEIRAAYDQGWIHPQHLPTLDATLTAFTDLQGGCERIKSTPIPFVYNVLLHRIVAIYCFSLPFGLVSTPGLSFYSPLVVALIAYAFFGLDAVGDEIEDPFGNDPNDLPLNAICSTIEANLLQRIGETELPPYPKPVNDILN